MKKKLVTPKFKNEYRDNVRKNCFGTVGRHPLKNSALSKITTKGTQLPPIYRKPNFMVKIPAQVEIAT